MRRGIHDRIAVLLLALAFLPAGAAAQQLRAVRVVNIGFTVADMDRSLDFYTRVLRFRKVADQQIRHPSGGPSRPGRARVVTLQLGDEQIVLTQYLDAPGRPFPPDTRSNDRWFQHMAIVVSDMQRAYAVLRQNHVRHASSLPQRLPDWNPNAAGIEAFYFRDPDGHYLELIHFPPGKGDPKWQHLASELFLGIDHTAIVVGDTERSLRFYRDQLGMRVAGESENYGPEQEHLNGVFGAHLRITSLRAEHGPGIELLEYLSPSDGRETPPDLRTSDIAHWGTRVELSGGAQPCKVERSANASVAASNSAAGQGGTECTIQDPDRHMIIFRTVSPRAASRIVSATEP